MISKILEKMILYFGQDIRRINHALKVYGFAKTICNGEKLSEKEIQIIELATVLHDIGIKEAERKYSSSSGKYQELEGPPIAEKMLASEDLDKAIVERVCYLVGNHHSYNKIDGIDFQILVEADFLVNIHEDSMDLDAVKSLKGKYFKTKSGIRILESIYDVPKVLWV